MLRASDTCLHGLGLSRNFLEKLKRYINLLTLDMSDKKQKHRYNMICQELQKSEDWNSETLQKKL